ncbi:MAG: hypothetical protein RSD32_02415 [Oscillospiraceae bacterium]
MRIYYADIRGLDESSALYPPLSDGPGSAFGTSLLAAAYKNYVGGKLPSLLKTALGRPFFPKEPELSFSISHSKTHVLVALSTSPLGADTEAHREINPDLISRLASPKELEGLSFFDIWVLRESLYKLTNEGDLRSLRFYAQNGKITPPIPGVHCRLYPDIENSSTAVCSYTDDFPDKLVKLPGELLVK